MQQDVARSVPSVRLLGGLAMVDLARRNTLLARRCATRSWRWRWRWPALMVVQAPALQAARSDSFVRPDLLVD